MFMTDDDIKRDRAIIDAATPGEWTTSVGVYEDPDGDEDLTFARGPMVNRRKFKDVAGWRAQGKADAAFVAAARTGWPRALDEVERLRMELRGAQIQIEDRGASFAAVLAERNAYHAVLSDLLDSEFPHLAMGRGRDLLKNGQVKP